ncbi:hypothetical protein C8Q76DRAFT_797015 [Earliella scabrosa]|nr:hypothetical protein C8Q76DRAFT_797015 [Earliella scabrosa]
MGRRAKHTTLDARREFKAAQARVYRTSAKGKEAKSRSNHRQYANRCAVARTSDDQYACPAFSLIIPRSLRMRAQSQLRASFAIHCDGPLLGLWAPPYQFEPPSSDALDGVVVEKEGHWTGHMAVLGAFQYGQMIEAGWTRAARWKTEGEAVLSAEVQRELVGRIEAWTKLAGAQNTVDEEAQEVALDWAARLVIQLVDEWECRTQGVEAYADALREGRLPWQQTMKEIKQLYADEN